MQKSKSTGGTYSRVLKYRNPDVVRRFAEDYQVSLKDAREIFTEMLRWLWLTVERRKEVDNGAKHFSIPLFNEALAVDLMWHTFLLYTEDYADFCQKYFGFFIHHRPRSRRERNQWQKFIQANPKAAHKERVTHLRKVYSYIYDKLGPKVLERWCLEYPDRFSHLPSYSRPGRSKVRTPANSGKAIKRIETKG